MRKDEKVEFRCTDLMKRRLSACRRTLGARSESETVRRLLEPLLDGAGDLIPSAAVPALREASLHLDRIANSLQRAGLDGSSYTELLADLNLVLGRCKEVLNSPNSHRSMTARGRRETR